MYKRQLQHKRQRDFLVPSLVGAERREDSEGYLAASRLILGGAFGYNLLLNANLRYKMCIRDRASSGLL